jgi:hypothetical protein
MSALNLTEAKKIGFNNEVPGLNLHIQTEVLTRRGIVIRTTILAGGVVKHAESHPVPTDVSDMIELAALARAQHQRCFDHIKGAGESWLESI